MSAISTLPQTDKNKYEYTKVRFLGGWQEFELKLLNSWSCYFPFVWSPGHT